MALGVLPLSQICEQVLIKNYLQLRDLGDIRYSLIKKILFKFSAQQLMNLEKYNPKLILDDEEVWFNLIQRQFPQDIHERYTTSSSKILEFFKQQLESLGFDYSDINLNNYINIKEVGNSKKFRLPSKLLFLKYQDDNIKKEELAIQNLRQRVQNIERSKAKNKVVQLDEIIPVPFIRSARSSMLKAKENRSKLFQKAQTEAIKHKDHFKNPLHLASNRVIHEPLPSTQINTSISPPTPQISTPSSISKPINVRVGKSTSPSKQKQVSIFITKKPTSSVKKKPTSLSPSPSSSSSVSPSPVFSNSLPNTPTAKDHNERTNTATTTSKPPAKRIKLGEYISSRTKA